MKTIDELKATAATVRDATEDKENTALRVGQLLVDMIDTLSNLSGESIKGYVSIDSTSELPEDPSASEQMIGYICGTTLYLYVGEGGDTLDGKYQSANLQGPQGQQGPAGADGHDGVDLGQVALVNNLEEGGEEAALTAEMGKRLREMIDNTTAVDMSDYTEKKAWINNSGKWETNPGTNNYKGKFVPIPSDAKSIIIVGNATQNTAYALLTTNLYAANTSVSFATGSSKTIITAGRTALITTIPSDAKYIWAATYSTKDINPQSISFSKDIWYSISVLKSSTESLQDEIEDLEVELLFVGNVVQKGYTASGLTDTNSKRVTMETSMVVPKESVTLRFKFPDWVKCAIRSGKSSDNLNTHDYYFKNGDTYTFSESACWFRICFTNIDDDTEIDVTDVKSAINNGAIKIYVEGEHSNIIERNASNESYVKAVMRPFVSGQNKNSGFHIYPVFAHTSDVHGDAMRFNAMADYCDYIGVDAMLVSGDMVARAPGDSMQYINDVADAHSSMVLPCMGNHDARTLVTAETQYNTIMKHLVEKYSVSTPTGEDYPTYFYKDFSDKKTRVISLNIYELAHTNDNVNFTQEQCEWFIATLASTPQGYGVLVMFHCPEKMPDKDNNYAEFYQDICNIAPMMANISGNPFTQIIDAFIGKISATITYSIGNTSISVSADFTSLASGVEFIAYVNGHLHIDRIGYLPSTTHKQLNLNIACGIAIYGGSTNAYYADISDMPRGCTGTTQDCFNIYVIDRATKTVRVARVGSNVTGDLTERKFMVIPYAD